MDGQERSSPETVGSVGTVPLDVLPLHSSTLLTVLDADGTIQYESPAIERIFGYHPRELLGESVANYFHPEDREDVLSAFSAVVSGDQETVESVEYRHGHAEGGYVWVESVAASNPTPAGNFVVNTRDMTERRNREQRLRAANERLEDFARVLSHDLRSPLNVAQGRLDLVAEACPSEHLESARTSLDRMEALIDELLDVAQVGDRALPSTQLQLCAVAEDVWAGLDPGPAELRCRADLTVKANERHLRQLLVNLFQNALEHGGEDVEVIIGAMPTGFYVQDDGEGFPLDAGEDLFEMGYSPEGGTGLGLGIVRQIARGHGWRVSGKDAPGGGARVEIAGVDLDS